jgi:hypothetical protein
MRYICTGRVQPERANVGFSRIEMQLDGGGKAIISCDSSQLTVLLENPNVDGFIAARLMAKDVAGIVIGALGFGLGCGYSFDLIQVTEESGDAHVFGVQPAGDSLAISKDLHEIGRAVQLGGRNVFFRLAVRDYLLAMTEELDCAFYSYRAIEGTKSAFALSAQGNGWSAMHAALGTDQESTTKNVKDFADATRHGNWVGAKYTDSALRRNMLQMTRDILVKYLDYAQPIQTAGDSADKPSSEAT